MLDIFAISCSEHQVRNSELLFNMWKGRCSLLLLLLCVSVPLWGQEERQAGAQEDDQSRQRNREEGGGETSQVSDPARNQSSEQGSHSQSASPGSSPKVGTPSQEKEREIVKFVPELSPR